MENFVAENAFDVAEGGLDGPMTPITAVLSVERFSKECFTDDSILRHNQRRQGSG